MSGDRILLVEDALSMQYVVQAAVGSLCSLTCVATIADAERELASGPYALLLLDVELPDGDGFEYCKKIRAQDKFQNLPIIFLTWKADVDQRVLGFSLGADDYIIKPIEPKEFSARIESKLKRRPQGAPQTTFRKSDFRVDLTSHRIFLVASDETEQELNLTPIEFKLLVHFLRNEGVVIPREELLTAVWGEAVHVSAHTIDTHISSLRKKISNTGHHLKAVVKKGYCFSIVSNPKPATI
ncbi:MAG: response regulator transcription factor [Bdellovibrionaceae bacterium]|nr:response regulator transcription factor [Pseudobdellovibrionaceae bacterium]